MAVVLPNTTLTVEVHAHPYDRDAHGAPVLRGDDVPVMRGPFPGAVNQPDQALSDAWSLRLDPRLGPVKAGDRIHAADGRVFIARADPRESRIPGHPAIDFIRVYADLDPPETL